MNNIEERLKEIKIENYIWIIYIGIILLSWYSNKLEKEYFLTNNPNKKNEYKKTIIIIFTILNLVYTYFLIDSKNSLKNINNNTDKKTKELLNLSFVAATLISISGIILLYVAITDEELDIELAFN